MLKFAPWLPLLVSLTACWVSGGLSPARNRRPCSSLRTTAVPRQRTAGSCRLKKS